MSPDTRLGRIGTLATTFAVGVAGVGDPGVVASSEGQFQAIVQKRTMPSISSPTLLFDPITQEPSPSVAESQGENLFVIEELNEKDGEFIDSLVGVILNPTPETLLMQRRLKSNPDVFFNAIRMPNARGLQYYPEGRENAEGKFHPELSILYSVDKDSSNIALSVQLRPSATFGQNALDVGLPKSDQYSAKQLALLMEYTFLMPEDLKALPWITFSSDPEEDPLIEHSSGLIFKESRVGEVQFQAEAYTYGLLYFSITVAKEQEKSDSIPNQAPGSVWPDGSHAA